MSEPIDDDLLNSGSDSETYDITDEKEDALLEDDEEKEERKGDNKYYDKRKSLSETEEDDVLHLYSEDDFQDEDKNIFDENDEKKTREKFSVEVLKKPSEIVTAQISNTAPSFKNRSYGGNSGQFQNVNKVGTRFEHRRRGTGRGNFQTRPKAGRQNMHRKRNGTVLINPRYQGTVHINDNNARLAWDNSHYPQNSNANFIPPWTAGSMPGNYEGNSDPELLRNLVTELATSLSQSSNLLQVQPPANQDYFQSSLLVAQPPFYEPPASALQLPASQQFYNSQNQHFPQWDNSFNHNQVSNCNMVPQSLGGYNPPIGTQFNHQIYNNRDNESMLFNARTNYKPNEPMQFRKNVPQNFHENKNVNYNKWRNKNNNLAKQDNYQKNFSRQHNYQNKSSLYRNENMQNRNPQFVSKQDEYLNKNNYTSTNNSGTTFSKHQTPSENFQFDFKQGSTNSTFNKPVQNTKMQQNPPEIQRSRSTFSGTTNHDNSASRTLVEPRIVRSPNENLDIKINLPEKKIKAEENTGQNVFNQTSLDADTTTYEDEEYRLKIEEQKREREKFLKLKEERRKLKMHQQEEVQKKQLAAAESLNQQQPTNVTPQNQKQNQSFPDVGDKSNYRPLSNNSVTDMSSLTFKITNTGVEKNVQETCSNFMTNRVVMVKNKNQKGGVVANPNLVKNVTNENSNQQGFFFNFFNNRKVLKKDACLLNSRLVVINNLSASTVENKLMAMTKGIGEIQSLRMDKQERQATILFKCVASAHAFFKKYQRHMLDLSMIEVKLEPMI